MGHVRLLPLLAPSAMGSLGSCMTPSAMNCMQSASCSNGHLARPPILQMVLSGSSGQASLAWL